MNRWLAWYGSLPDTPRKAVRDFAAIFVASVVASGALTQDTPDLHVVWKAVVAAAGLASWRVVRGIVQGATPA